jgi:hypothetical protein
MSRVMPSGMDHRVTALERAFQLARSGKVSGLRELVKMLTGEGYSAHQIEGPALKRQLADLIKAARKVDTNGHRTLKARLGRGSK